MDTRTDLLNFLVKEYDLKTYLEIGVQKKKNFNQVAATIKRSVDPDPKANADYVMTSDEYFEKHPDTYDLIFIDGLHHADQVKKDFENALKVLSDKGFIVLHDTWPAEEVHTRVPRETSIWNGDVYKFACSLSSYSGINYTTFTFNHGCTVIWKDVTWQGIPFLSEPTWEWFLENREPALLVGYSLPDK